MAGICLQKSMKLTRKGRYLIKSSAKFSSNSIVEHVLVSFFILGIVLTSASQLRFFVGPGEILLVLWAIFASAHLWAGKKLLLNDQFVLVLFFSWIVIFLLLSASFVGVYTGRLLLSNSVHDAVSFCFVIVCLLIFFSVHGRPSTTDRILRLFFFFLLFFLVGLFVVSLINGCDFSDKIWFHGTRFRGLAKNPNQTALFLVSMPFLGWYLLSKTYKLKLKLFYLIQIVVFIALGFITRSDALYVAWIATFMFLLLRLFGKYILCGTPTHFCIGIFCLSVLVLIIVLIEGDFLFSIVQQKVLLYSHGDPGNQVEGGNVRFLLWQNAIDVIQKSPLIGFGPGTFSGIHGPFTGEEAHNSMLDWGMSTGVIGMLFLALLGIYFFLSVLRSGCDSLLGMFVSLIIFSCFHYVLRQPVFWLLLFSVNGAAVFSCKWPKKMYDIHSI